MTPRVKVSSELASAMRAVNAAYNRLTAEAQASIEIAYDGLDAEIDAAIVAADRERALAAIRAWRGYWLHEFEEAAR